ncbi:NAD(P)-dependent alcohol dehydrogenase [Agriterribacter sp.]|uniref:NAD(P)-dependent alcohol dehydrogenase n=1 Tax=Agriterribacter sp. TaxID=2821509 RepID=UPI002BE90499|nr:NAD(P)-dependent alcohol dehydrogenase [Agriterribacter sp.]HTN07188.1 NAD(P)-dependent alcohol dehydrogenase [Agriterribacter sp.]
MKAVICTKYGPPEVLHIVDVEKPVPKDKEILVRIVAASVNSGDVRVRGLVVTGFMKIIFRFVIGFSKPRRPILGTVFSGVVEQIGSGVTQFNAGDEVFGITGFKFGTYAEYIAVNEKSNVLLKPVNTSFEEAAAIPFGGQTAIYFLEKAGIKQKANLNVLIIGATGSVGSAAIQVAQHYSANITAVCSSSGVEIARSLGVTNLILYDKEDFTKYPMKFDIVFDAVGKTTKKQCLHLLNQGGVFKSVAGLEYASETKEQLVLLKELFEKGDYKAVIDKTFSMNEVVAAHRYVDTGRKKGNVVLKITE